MRSVLLAFAVLSTQATAQEATVSGTDGQNALGTVPCAAVPGQQIESCPAEFRRKDDGASTLAVQLKTGEVRRIYFEGTKAVASSSTSALSTETRGDMLIIYIEPGEVYELPLRALTSQ